MLSEKRWRALSIALLIAGIGLIAVSIWLTGRHDLMAAPTLRKLAHGIAPLGGVLIGISLRRTKLRAKISDAIGYEADTREQAEREKPLRDKARAVAVNITLTLFAVAALVVFIFTDAIWITFTILGICFLHLIIESCLTSYYRRKNAE